MKRKLKVIIDTDPGVDDVAALIFALNEPQLDIQLLTVSSGNVHMNKTVRNVCHILDIFNKDIPVIQGYENRLGTNDEYAYHIHGPEGFGWYEPPDTTVRQPLNVDCADALYEIFKKNPKEITFVILGPHTNFAYLLRKHPDVVKYIKNVVMMGGSIDGIKCNRHHRSFNIRTDAPAFKYTVDSHAKVTMCPSKIGRDYVYFTEEQIKELGQMNDIGKFMEMFFQTYWEPGYEEKIIANCDIAAIVYLTHPKLFKTKRAFVEVDTEVNVGATLGHFDRKGNFTVIKSVNRNQFQDVVFERIKELSELEITDKTFWRNMIRGVVDPNKPAEETPAPEKKRKKKSETTTKE